AEAADAADAAQADAEAEALAAADAQAESDDDDSSDDDSDDASDDSDDASEQSTIELGDETFTEDEMALIEKARAADKKGGKRAIDAWRAAVAAMPDKSFPRERLKQLYIDNNKWSNVADLYKDQIKSTDDDDDKIPLYWELLGLYRDHLKQPGLVVTTLSALEKLVEATGDNVRLLAVVEAQQEQFEQMKRWPDLISRIRRRAELTTDPEGRTALHLEAGRLFLEKFNNQAEAIKSFEAVLEADEFNVEAISKLKDLYAKRRDWEKLVNVQQKELTLIEDPAQRTEQLLQSG